MSEPGFPELIGVKSAATAQDLREVWFSGVHSDVGGVFSTGTKLSDIPLKWMVDEAVAAGVGIRPDAYRKITAQADAVDPGGGLGMIYPVRGGCSAPVAGQFPRGR
jgi:hypothetical protein